MPWAAAYESAAIPSRTAAADRSSAAFSSAESPTSTISLTP